MTFTSIRITTGFQNYNQYVTLISRFTDFPEDEYPFVFLNYRYENIIAVDLVPGFEEADVINLSAFKPDIDRASSEKVLELINDFHESTGSVRFLIDTLLLKVVYDFDTGNIIGTASLRPDKNANNSVIIIGNRGLVYRVLIDGGVATQIVVHEIVRECTIKPATFPVSVTGRDNLFDLIVNLYNLPKNSNYIESAIKDKILSSKKTSPSVDPSCLYKLRQMAIKKHVVSSIKNFVPNEEYEVTDEQPGDTEEAPQESFFQSSEPKISEVQTPTTTAMMTLPLLTETGELKNSGKTTTTNGEVSEKSKKDDMCSLSYIIRTGYIPVYLQDAIVNIDVKIPALDYIDTLEVSRGKLIVYLKKGYFQSKEAWGALHNSFVNLAYTIAEGE